MNSRNPKDLRDLVSSSRKPLDSGLDSPARGGIFGKPPLQSSRSNDSLRGFGFGAPVSNRQQNDSGSDSDDSVAVKMRASKAKAFSESDKLLINDLKAKLSEQKNELDGKTAALAAVQRNFESLSNMCRNDKEEIARLNRLLAETKVQLDEYKSVSDKLVALESKYEKDIKSKDSVISSLKNEIEAMRITDSSRKSEFESIISKIQSSQKGMLLEHEAMKQSLQTLQSELDDARKKTKQLENQLSSNASAYEEKVQSYITQIQDHQMTKSGLEKQISSQQNEMSSLMSNLSTVQSKLKSISAEYSDYKNMQAQMQSDARLDKEKSISSISSLTQRARELEMSLRQSERSNQELKEKCLELESTLENERKQFEAHNHNIRLALQEAHNRLQSLQEEGSSSRDMFERSAEKIKNLEQKVVQSQKALSDKDIVISQKNEEIEKIQISIKELTKRTHAAEIRADQIASTLLEKDRQIQVLSKDLQNATSLDAQGRAQIILSTEKELKSVVAKLIHSNEAMQANITCMFCLNNLKQPETCFPCGHSFCSACIVQLKEETLEHGTDRFCHLCGPDHAVDCSFRNESLEQICAKYEYQQQALTTLTEMSKKLGQLTAKITSSV